MTSPTKQLRPLQHKHVASSGLRARRVGLVHGQAYCWRIFARARGRLWVVERTRVRSVDDLRDDGESVEVATLTTRALAAAAIDSDADVLEKLGPLPRRSSRAYGGVGDIDYFGEDGGA